MNILFYSTVACAIFSAVAMLTFHQLGMEKRLAARRLVQMTRERRSALDAGSPRDQSTYNRAIRALQALVAGLPLGFMRHPQLQATLAAAGYRDSTAADIYVFIRLLVPVIALLIAACIPAHRGFLILALPGVAYITPGTFLRKKTAKRREEIRSSLPAAIDLLVICVEAGLGLDQALFRVSQELGLSHPAMTEELMQLNLEQRAGKPRVQAWQAMADRLDLPEVKSFLNMLIQTERFGTPIGRALSVFAEGLREKRRQLAEERAAKTTVKIVVPLALFMFPSIFVILLGPAALTLLRNFKALGH